MHRGHIKLFRKIREWSWYKDYVVKDVFIEILLTANHKDKTVGGYEVKRGQLMTSYASLSANTGLTIKQIRRAIIALKRASNVASKATHQHTIITVCDYEDYNNHDNDKGQAKGHTTGQAKGTRRATTKNEKNKEEEKPSKSSPKFVVDNPPDKIEMYAHYKEKDFGFDIEQFFNTQEASGWKDKNDKKYRNWKGVMATWQGFWKKSGDKKWSVWDEFDTNQIWHMCDIDKNQAACVEYNRRRAFKGSF